MTQPAAAPEPDPFDDARLLEIAIDIDPRSWDELRFQHHDPSKIFSDECLAGPAERPYTYFDARVTIAGQTFEASNVRKKGFLGSVSSRRPSLKVKLGGKWRGISRLTLNNNQQDTSNVHQCLAYRIFRAAGVPAPRCALARVTVNGVSKGVFSHVEPIRKPFLRRQFGDDAGNLYEGAISDFRPEWTNTFQRKTNRKGDRNDLWAITGALEKSDRSALGRAVDLEAFYAFWAAETLLGHWDSYSNNNNNFYAYSHPKSGAFHFIPWGVDSAFGDPDVFARGEPPLSVYANSALPRFLYDNEETRARYIARLRELLTKTWNEDALVAEADRLWALAEPHLHLSKKVHQAGIDKVKAFIRGRRAAIEAELANGPPAWTLPPRSSPCPEEVGKVSGEFLAPWGNLQAPDFTSGQTKLALELRGETVTFNSVGAAAATLEEAGERAAIALVGIRNNAPMVIAMLMVDPERYRAGQLPIDSYAVFGAAMTLSMGSKPEGLGGLRGTLTLREIGAKVSGSFEATLMLPKYFSDPLQ